MPSSARVFEAWNRKLHFYLGLYFLFFLWLFSVTGLMLNHQQWFRDLNNRVEKRYEAAVEMPAGDTMAARTRDLMGQLNLRGEMDWPALQPDGHLNFNVSRPNGSAQVRVDLNAKKADVLEFGNNKRLAFQVFHTFSGTRVTQPASQRDWIVTSLWVWAMDALAAGLIVMVFGSYYMWFRLKPKRGLGLVVLAAGVVSCGAFAAGLL